jgi:lipid A 4'-phosphatase
MMMMNRTGLICALMIGVVAGALFGLYPDLDLLVAAHFHTVDGYTYSFPYQYFRSVLSARSVGLWLVTALIATALGALAIKLILPWTRLLMSGRAIIFLITTMILGPGLMANAILKEHWSRPRPVNVTEFGGSQNFVPWWDPRGDCSSNCSFVSGDVVGAFWTVAPAALAPPQWRALAYGAAIAFGTGMAALRVMSGGHFLSDVIFSGVFTFLIVWIMYALIYRWPLTRLSDDDVERTLTHVTSGAYALVAGLFGRMR